eukprot:7013730-Prymnesium_polylepis.1
MPASSTARSQRRRTPAGGRRQPRGQAVTNGRPTGGRRPKGRGSSRSGAAPRASACAPRLRENPSAAA